MGKQPAIQSRSCHHKEKLKGEQVARTFFSVIKLGSKFLEDAQTLQNFEVAARIIIAPKISKIIVLQPFD